eukprot:330061_1
MEHKDAITHTDQSLEDSMDTSTKKTTLKHVAAKIEWMHYLQKDGYVSYDQLVSMALKIEVDEYYVRSMLLRDLPVVIVTVYQYEKLKYPQGKQWVLLLSFPDNLNAFFQILFARARSIDLWTCDDAWIDMRQYEQ